MSEISKLEQNLIIKKIDEETAISRLEKLMNIDKTPEDIVDIETEDDFEEEVE